MDKNYEWFIKADLSSYEGLYVAIAQEKVVANGEDPGKVYEQAKKQFPKEEVVLWRVPSGEAFVFILLNAD